MRSGEGENAVTTGLIIIAVIVVLMLFVVSIYNRLVGMRQTVNQGLADIDAQLRQRHDLIPNLVSTVKGYPRTRRRRSTP